MLTDYWIKSDQSLETSSTAAVGFHIIHPVFQWVYKNHTFFKCDAFFPKHLQLSSHATWCSNSAMVTILSNKSICVRITAWNGHTTQSASWEIRKSKLLRINRVAVRVLDHGNHKIFSAVQIIFLGLFQFKIYNTVCYHLCDHLCVQFNNGIFLQIITWKLLPILKEYFYQVLQGVSAVYFVQSCVPVKSKQQNNSKCRSWLLF